MADNETITDIIADMRRDADADDITPDCILGQKLNYLADRLEATHKREMSKNVSKNEADFGQLGDAAAMCEALRKINGLCGVGVVEISSFEIGSICDDALSAPPRNCDVGTAEEQAERLRRFCIRQDCATCPCNIGKADGRCEFAWAQLPYEEGGAK